MAGKDDKPKSRMDPGIEDPNALAALIADPLGDDDYAATIAFLGGDDEALDGIEDTNTPEATSSSDPPGSAAKDDADATAGGETPESAGTTTKGDTAADPEGAHAGDAGTADAQADPGDGSDASVAGDTTGVAAVLPEHYARDTLFELAKAENKRLHEQIRTLQGQGGTGRVDPAGADPGTQSRSVDLTGLKAKVEKVKSDYGEEIGDVLDGLLGGVETLTSETPISGRRWTRAPKTTSIRRRTRLTETSMRFPSWRRGRQTPSRSRAGISKRIRAGLPTLRRSTTSSHSDRNGRIDPERSDSHKRSGW